VPVIAARDHELFGIGASDFFLELGIWDLESRGLGSGDSPSQKRHTTTKRSDDFDDSNTALKSPFSARKILIWSRLFT
jgi:hypothetical protein